MPRLLFLSLVFAPDSVSTAVIMTELALDLQALGHEVTVLTATPHYNVEPDARARQPLRPRWDGLLYESECQGIPVYHARIPPKSARVATRLAGYAIFHGISTLAGVLLDEDYDVILAPSPPLTIGLSAWLLGLLRRVPFIYNVQEIYPDVAVSMELLRNRRIIWLLEQLERFVYARASAVVVISEWFRRVLLRKGVSASKLHVIPNFVDVDFMQPGPRDNEFARQHGLDSQFVVLYAGNIGLTQGFETIVEAACALVGMHNLRVVIVGDGARRAWLEQSLAALKLDNITLLPYQPRSVVPQIYASSDVCLVPLKKGTAQGTFPSKIYTIMASGRPAIVSADADSEAVWLVQQAQCGLAVPPDAPDALAQAIVQAYQERGTFRTYGENGRRYVVQHHSRQAVARQYHELITALLNHPS